MHRALHLVAATALLAGLAGGAPPKRILDGLQRDFALAEPRPVLRVFDATTLLVEIEGKPVQLGLLGVDAPDRGPGADAILRCTTQMLLGETVYVEYDPRFAELDDRGRLPAYVFRAPDGLFVNLELIRQGYARLSRIPAAREHDVLRYFEEQARKAGKGIWRDQPDLDESAAQAAPTSRPAPSPDNEPPQRVTAPTAPASTASATVYITRSGGKYHLAGCRFLRQSAVPIQLRDAIAQGFEPCSSCKPPAPSR